MKKIGIIGNGFVGSAIVHGFALHADIKIFDVDPTRSTHTFEETVNTSDFIFICIPTPMKSVLGGQIDLTIMDDVFEKISQTSSNSNSIFVIKSTVVPGTTEKYIKKYPNLRIVFNPEFLTERAARLDFINSARIVIGGNNEDTGRLESLYRHRFPYKAVIKTDPSTAQLIKYMANCFFSVKVSFMNEMRQISDALDANWEDALHGFILDGRVGNSHLDVPGHDGSLGFGGKCFPKDLNAMIHRAEELSLKPTVLKAAWEKNLEVREKLDWSEIDGAVSDT